MMRALRLALSVSIAAGAIAGGSGMVFEFSSGAPNHPEGFGAWTVRWDGRQLAIEHRVRDRVTRYPAVAPAAEDSAALGKLIEAARLEEGARELRAAPPGRVPASFKIRRGAKETTAKVWVDWDRPGDPVTQLVRKLGELIERHTGTRPVLIS
jgi:hypothetical protein